MNNLAIGTRLSLAFGLLIVIMIAVGWMGLSQMSKLHRNLDSVVEKRYALVQKANDAVEHHLDNARSTIQLFLAKDKNEIDQILAAMSQNSREISDILQWIEGSVETGKERELFDQVKAARPMYLESRDRMKKLLLDGKHDEAAVVLSRETLPRLSAYRQTWASLVDYEESQMTAAVADNDASHALSRKWMIGLIALAAVFAAALALAVTRSITSPIFDVVHLAELIARGDLRSSIEVTRKDEAGRLQVAMSTMVEKLARTIGEMRLGASALSSASAYVSAASQTLSQGAQDQAASMEETISSLEEMSASINQNAESSRQMEQMAVGGARDAESSGRAVRDTVEAMRGITEKINIIEEIAYQTNLLALNAAIEAARAGEHGRGFAVVATEVRRLAERSQTAAKEISDLASSSVKVAEKSGDLLDQLVPSIRKTTDLVQDVAASSREQSMGVSQISKAMTQVDGVTQRNASAAEELATTSEEMASQAEALDRLMGFFQINIEPSSTYRDRQAAMMHHDFGFPTTGDMQSPITH
jgi:methyl-accepting chemotaxis protein